MPRKRNSANAGLPTGWRYRLGAYRYQVPKPLRPLWGGKSEVTLGKTLPDAYRVWAEKLELQQEARTIADLLDQYAAQVVPLKTWKTRESNQISLGRLRKVFGSMPIAAIEPHHAYRYITLVTEKHGATSARRDFEVLRHCYTKAVEWGLVRRHPLLGQVRMAKPVPRDRYVSDSELAAALELAPPLLRAYVELKLLTGLRRKDLLLLRRDDVDGDHLTVRPTKTAHSSGVRLRFEITPELRAAIEAAKAVPRKVGSLYLFPNRVGACYVDQETGRANGFDSLWSRWMRKVVAAGGERFQERDLRAKSASDDPDIEEARRRLGHTAEQITRSVYRRQGELVRPLNRKTPPEKEKG